MLIENMTPEELLAYDRFCADLAEFGDTDGGTENLIPLFAEVPF